MKLIKQNTAQRRAMIIGGPIPRTILMLSAPALLLGLVQAIIPIIDGLFINNIVGTVAASAIHYSAPLVGIFGALAQGLSVAGMAIIGQAVGKADYADARRVSVQLTVAAFLGGLILVPLMIAAAFPIAARVTPEISDAVRTYLTLNALVLPFSFIGAVYNAIKNAYGRPEDTFARILILMVLKGAFNSLFIGLLGWGLVGAVLSTLTANILICVWMYYELFAKPGPERLSLAGFHVDKPIMRELGQVGFPSILSSLILNLGFVLINNEVQKYGAIVLNGAGIASNISNLCFLLPSSYGTAITTLVSMNIGAEQEKRAKRACFAGCVISSLTAALLIAIIVPLTPRLTLFFTRQQAVLDVANNALSIYLYAVIGFGITMVLQGAFIGLGRTRITVVISLLRVWLLRYLFILVTEKYLGYNAVFWGSLFSNYASMAITLIMILKVKWVSVIPPRRTTAS
ncbi:MAG: MATE family efflux transporter [Clostridiaceae bacterium]|jgi:putative MATE family efflux protein|nr:MATE family efflux transporter [Clostridiaceae bacterium]